MAKTWTELRYESVIKKLTAQRDELLTAITIPTKELAWPFSERTSQRVMEDIADIMLAKGYQDLGYWLHEKAHAESKAVAKAKGE